MRAETQEICVKKRVRAFSRSIISHMRFTFCALRASDGTRCSSTQKLKIAQFMAGNIAETESLNGLWQQRAYII